MIALNIGKYITKKYGLIIWIIGLLGLFAINMQHWANPYAQTVISIGIFVILASWWKHIFKKVFGYNRNSWITWLLALWTSFFLFSLITGAMVVWYTLNPPLIWLAFIITTTITYVLWKQTKKSKDGKHKPKFTSTAWRIIPKSKLLILLFVILWVLAAGQLAISATGGNWTTPWHTIEQYYLITWFFASLTLALIVCSKHKTKHILLLIIAHSLLTHAYLPLTNNLPWGGDVWRMIAVEEHIDQGGKELPVLFGEDAKWRDVHGVSLPEAILIPNKYVYGQLWGFSIATHQITNLSFVAINKWLVPLLWSIFIPIIFFKIGTLLFRSYRKGILFAALSLVPFTWQVLGGLTLAVSLGYLNFFFVMMLWLQYLRDRGKQQRNIVLLFAALMLFSYTLHFLLIWMVIIASAVVFSIEKKWKSSSANAQVLLARKGIYTVLAIAAVCSLPVIELLGKTSIVPQTLFNVTKIKQLIGQLSGWYYASAIRPHDMLSGNIFFNHTPDYAFYHAIFTSWRWYLIPLLILIWGSSIIGLWYIHKQKQQVKIAWIVLGLLFAATIGSYLIGWGILDGDRSFIRRLDGLVAFVVILFAISGMSAVIKKTNILANKRNKIIIVATSVVLLSWTSALTYASGPDIRAVTQDEYDVAGLIADTAPNNEPTCVIADTWVLLALEALSAKNIVGGGFPIDYQFGQPERVVLLSELKENPRPSILTVAHKLTNANTCYGVLPASEQKAGQPDKKEQVSAIFNSQPKQIGNLLMWAQQLNNTAE